MKRISLLIGVLTVVALSGLQANRYDPYRTQYNQNYSNVQYDNNRCQNDNNCCQSCDSQGSRFFGGADFLWWKAAFKDMDYAISFTGDGAADGIDAKYHYIQQDFEPGVRGYIGLLDFACGWNLTGSYTYIKGDHSARTTAGTDELLISSIVNGDVQLFGDTISAKQKYRYQSFDVLLGNSFECGCYGVLSPFFGVEGVRIDQRLSSIVGQESLTTGDDELDFSWDADFKGVGLKAGLGYSHEITQCIGFYGKASTSILYGEYDSTRFSSQVSSAVPLTFKIDSDYHGYVPGYHIALGFNYSSSFCGKSLAVNVGWEFLQWLNMSTPRRFSQLSVTPSATSGAIGFNGLTAGLQVCF